MPEQDTLIQPVNKPILCNPYEEPNKHWFYDTNTGEAMVLDHRRPASYFYKVQRTGGEQQLSFLAEETREDLFLVNALREDIAAWRKSEYDGATEISKELLRYWRRDGRTLRLFFCQMEAAETVIFLNEIRLSGKRIRFKPKFTDAKLEELKDHPGINGMKALTRLGLKMATGSGKTVVMAMLAAWSMCNRGQTPSDTRFPSAVLAVCPNLTIKERLQVLRPENIHNYYEAFDLVPARLRPLLAKGKVMVTNWHLFAPASEHSEGGRTYTIVNKGEESPEAFARRVLGDLYGRGRILVFNDEAHHAWRPPAGRSWQDLEAPEDEIQEATVWVNGLDMLNEAVGIQACVDFSATPFYIGGSGEVEGKPFPWLVSDFGLVDAIESGIVKIPRLPVSDETGRPEPKYFRLWQNVTENLGPADRLPGKTRKPKPTSVYRDAEAALLTLAAQWKERFDYIQESSTHADKTPPVLIIVCDNTDLAELIFRAISGEMEVEELETTGEEVPEEEGEDTNGRSDVGSKKPKKKIVYGQGRIFPELLGNTPTLKRTIRIDSKLLAEAEAGEGSSRKEEAERLREIVATVGKRGQPGEQVRCVVSVAMLNEGWDANNVTHIFGLRAFTSQLLCEQVVGRGLRRMDYTVDPKTGMLTEEYVDIYGVPFSLIPFRGRQTNQAQPDDRPKNHVRAMEERAAYEMRFPNVEGYVFSLRKNLISADIDKMERLVIEPMQEPTAVFVKPRVEVQVGMSPLHGPGEFVRQTREEYYATTHLQQIEYEAARQIVALLVGDEQAQVLPQGNLEVRMQSRHALFPQVLRLVRRYVEEKVTFHGVNKCELGLQIYMQKLVSLMVAAIRPSEDQGEPPLLPILNRYQPIGSTAGVDFKTTKRVVETMHSHINAVAADTHTWEEAATFKLEEAALRGRVVCYARNEEMGFAIPYVFMSVDHQYIPDFIVRLSNGVTLVLEIKGEEKAKEAAKHEGARRWMDAINNWGKLGRLKFMVCRDPQELGLMIDRELMGL